MAGGINHAKKIVIDEATCLADKLQNGNSGCRETQGKAIGLLVKMITPLYIAEFVTVEDCEEKHKVFMSQKTPSVTKIKIGPVSVEGPITSALLTSCVPIACLCGVIYMVGVVQNWW